MQACLVYGVGFGGIGAMLSLLVIDTFGAAHFGIMGGIQTGVVRLLRPALPFAPHLSGL